MRGYPPRIRAERVPDWTRRIRRPPPGRASRRALFLLAIAAALTATLVGESGLAAAFIFVATVAFLSIWAKWGFNPLRLPVCVCVPFVLVFAYARGFRRAIASGSFRRPTT